jgi:HAD superfamily hydrolase (TIGR01549 family)
MNIQIKAVLFDFDGTLTHPGAIDFAAAKAAVGCPLDRPILEHIQAIPSAASQKEAMDALDRLEMQSASQSRPHEGAESLLQLLMASNMKIGILSRNSRSAIRRALKNFQHISEEQFDVILSRDDPFPPKPSPEGIQEAAQRLGVPINQVLVVGDWTIDIEAGQRAGAPTVYLTTSKEFPAGYPPPDHQIDNLSELPQVLDWYTPLAAGKLPNRLLHQFLKELTPFDSSLLIGPRVGEDFAAVQWKDEDVLILKSDPVTFAGSAIGYYAVTVNANDVATAGATPRWLLTTLLFPLGTTAAQVQKVLRELQEAAAQQGLTLTGGHTEITDSVNRPVVIGQVAGTVTRERLIDKRRMAAGDKLILTKAIAIEGTCILARDFADRLLDMGLSPSELVRSKELLTNPGISILKEARIAAELGCATALHDVTEGGVATAIEELSAAGGHRLRVFLDRIPILAETENICQLLGIQPLGLIGSGSLLIVCRSQDCERLLRALECEAVRATCIGEVLEAGTGIDAVGKDGDKVEWPHFEVDEIARLYQS